ncbi:carboxylating nicotinate-nucleotide diphosphorylase [Metabacillus indicus]|uniref:Probable nicotinate-nucleotide pyrophosphorylase [carboxylating] n=1 Tax=Metabacillus indicus TaxID=246786 RepID=A0A084GWY0_METID|nr:carboxylating nicotinate-nucleotide diphosphorylase [Metabacillus indicus]KEZ51842.1 nicotinate-nucleotide pyrophosphorylase [Metabacillus indicus]
MNLLKLKKQLEGFFAEDIGDFDATSTFIFSEGQTGSAVIRAKEDGIFAGADVVKAGYAVLDPRVTVQVLKRDGEAISRGEKAAVLTGPIASILTGERVVLNLLQRMSGIATLTNQAVKLLNSDHTKICDTRKTTPGLRMIEKYAVRCGGGYNHRFGLYDGIMLKDNHIASAGSIAEAVQKARAHAGHMIKIEVEIETEQQLHEAISARADIIMFDNRTPDEAAAFAAITPESIITEASGGITLENLADYGRTGVNYVSLGILTHSAKALDLSMNVE